MFDTVLVAGLGLMGGSMAKTIKARTLSRVLGWNRTRATAEQALADGSIDAIATDALFREVDLVIIGLYPQATVDWLLENMPKMKKHSTKQVTNLHGESRRVFAPSLAFSVFNRKRPIRSGAPAVRAFPTLQTTTFALRTSGRYPAAHDFPRITRPASRPPAESTPDGEIADGLSHT